MNWRQVAGVILIVVGCMGVVTVADDLDHAGELFSVGGMVLAGVALLGAGSRYVIARRWPLHWIPIGIGVGEALGAVLDRMPVAVLSGAALGTLGAAISGLRRAGIWFPQTRRRS